MAENKNVYDVAKAFTDGVEGVYYGDTVKVFPRSDKPLPSAARMAMLLEDGYIKEREGAKTLAEYKAEIEPEQPQEDAKEESEDIAQPVEETPSAPAEEASETVVNYDEMSVEDLKGLAKERGLTGYSALKRTELVALLNQ